MITYFIIKNITNTLKIGFEMYKLVFTTPIKLIKFISK